MLITQQKLMQNSVYWTPHLIKKLLGEPDHNTKYGGKTLKLYCPQRIKQAEQTAVFKFRKQTIDDQLKQRRYSQWQHPAPQADLFAT